MSDDRDDTNPPSATRVARRALDLVVLSCRAAVEPDADRAAEFWNEVRDWFAGLGIADEFEADELAVFDAPLGELTDQDLVNASWRSEAAAVLAWALKRYEPERHDRQVDPQAVADALGWLKPREETVLADPVLRTDDEQFDYREQLFAVHWRLDEFRLRPEPMDFRKVAATAWFGPLIIAGVPLVDGDLAIGDTSISQAPHDLRSSVASIALERHRAINWLAGYSDIFSETPTDT